MYHAHSKDINRNKSFHPLTYANLHRVEQLKEKQDEQQRARDARAKELRRDQEERRYDELVLGTTATDGDVTTSAHLAHFRQVKNIFAAEYATSANNNDDNSSGGGSSKKATAAAASQTPPPSAAIALKYNLADKFHLDSDTSLKAEHATSKSSTTADDGDVANASMLNTSAALTHASASVGAKRERDDADATSRVRAQTEQHDSKGSSGSTVGSSAATAPQTGYVSSSEAARLRKELDLVKKQRLDPLRRVQQFHNSTVAAAAARAQAQQQQQQQRQQQHAASGTGATTDAQASLKEHIKRMLNM